MGQELMCLCFSPDANPVLNSRPARCAAKPFSFSGSPTVVGLELRQRTRWTGDAVTNAPKRGVRRHQRLGTRTALVAAEYKRKGASGHAPSKFVPLSTDGNAIAERYGGLGDAASWASKPNPSALRDRGTIQREVSDGKSTGRTQP